MKSPKLQIIGAVITKKYIEIANPCRFPIELMEDYIKSAKGLKNNHQAFACCIMLPKNILNEAKWNTDKHKDSVKQNKPHRRRIKR